MKLGVRPERYWPELEVLEHDACLACLSIEDRWLLIYGVRELLGNAFTHSAVEEGEAELITNRSGTAVTLRIPGPPFDSVSASSNPGNRWLHRYTTMLHERGVGWTWAYAAGYNVFLFTIKIASDPEAPSK